MTNSSPNQDSDGERGDDIPQHRWGVAAFRPIDENSLDQAGNAWTLMDIQYVYDQRTGHTGTPVLSTAPEQGLLTPGEQDSGVLLYKRDTAEGTVQLEDFNTLEALLSAAHHRRTQTAAATIGQQRVRASSVRIDSRFAPSRVLPRRHRDGAPGSLARRTERLTVTGRSLSSGC